MIELITPEFITAIFGGIVGILVATGTFYKLNLSRDEKSLKFKAEEQMREIEAKKDLASMQIELLINPLQEQLDSHRKDVLRLEIKVKEMQKEREDLIEAKDSMEYLVVYVNDLYGWVYRTFGEDKTFPLPPEKIAKFIKIGEKK